MFLGITTSTKPVFANKLLLPDLLPLSRPKADDMYANVTFFLIKAIFVIADLNNHVMYLFQNDNGLFQGAVEHIIKHL